LIEAVLMIAAPAGRCGSAALVIQNMAYTLVLKVASNCSVVMSSSDLRSLLVARVVDHDVEPAQRRPRIGHQLAAEGLVPDVAGQRHRLAARGANQLHHLARVFFLLGQVAERHVGAFARKAMAAARPMPESPPVISALRPASRPEPA
jgi:hypothetical protein